MRPLPAFVYRTLISAAALVSTMNSARVEEAGPTTGAENAASVLILGLSGAAWERILIGATIAGVLMALLVGVSAAGSILARKREAEAAARSLDRYKASVAHDVAAARTEGVGLGQAFESTLGRAACDQTKGKAAPLPRFLEEGVPLSPAMTDKLAARMNAGAPARESDLTTEKAAALIDALRGGPGNISIDYDGADAKAQPLSAQLQDIFRRAGWNVSSGITLGLSNPPASGLLIRVNKDGATAVQGRVVQALRAADIPFDIRTDREPRSPIDGRVHAPIGMGVDDVEVVVTGSKS